MRPAKRLAVTTALCGALFYSVIATPALAAVPRTGDSVGAIVAVSGEEQIRFATETVWRDAEIRQDLLTGDNLETGPHGGLSLRFIDQTIVQIQHDSQLVVKAVPVGGTAQLQLDNGTMWARAASQGTGVDVVTPAATAAIRGTDWQLSVVKGQTTLKVMAGTVVLRNAQGSVSVSAGEAAIAEIGRAPSKIVIAVPTGREQFLYHIGADSAFAIWPATDLRPTEERAAAAAIKAKSVAVRSSEELVTLAEISLHLDGNAAAQAMVTAARARSDLTTGQRARLDLVQAMLDGRRHQWAVAAAGFLKAEPQLTGIRRYAAAFGAYVALGLDRKPAAAKAAYQRLQQIPRASLANPAYAELAQVWIDALYGDTAAAFDRTVSVENLDPKDPRPAQMAAQLAILLGRDKEARQHIDKAMAIDPDDGEVLTTVSVIQQDYDYDYDRAVATARRAVTQAPGYAWAWNELGLVLGDQGDTAGAAKAFEQATALDPYDPTAAANYAILLLDNNQLAAAKKQIDRAFAADPSFHTALLAKGRWQIQQGETKAARDTFLEAVAADPGISESAQGLAIAYYQSGDVKHAEQQLDAAERLDPHDPTVPLIRTVIALDQSEADTAIVNARESFKRYRDRGGIYSSLAQSRTDGSYLNAAFDKLSLNDWSRYYGDLLFDPFNSSSLFYEAVTLQRQAVFTDAAPANANGMASLTQGLLLDPLSVAARNRFTDLFRRPFIDTTASGNVAFDDHGEIGWGAGGDIQGFNNKGIPLSFALTYDHGESRPSRADSLNNTENATLYLGLTPTLDDRIVLWGRLSDIEDQIPHSALVEDSTINEKVLAGTQGHAVDAGIGYSHSFGARNMVNAVFEGSTGGAHLINNDTGSGGGNTLVDDVTLDVDTTSFYGGLSHTIDLGPLTLNYGAEGGREHTPSNHDEVITLNGTVIGEAASSEGNTSRMGRLFVDGKTVLGHGISLEGGLNLDRFSDDTIDRLRLDPRIALAWQPIDGQWFRVGYRQDLQLPLLNSLAPVTTLGLVPGSTPISGGGIIKSAMARWDAEWSDRFFTSLDYEHQWLRGYSVTIQDALGSTTAEEGHLDRLTASANAWLGGGFGTFASASVARSHDTSAGGEGGDLPFVPDWQTNFGLTWVSPEQLSVTLAENIIGSRISSAGNNHLGTAAVTNLTLDWQPLEKHLDLGVGIFNIFDADYNIASGVSAPGRTFAISGEVRF